MSKFVSIPLEDLARLTGKKALDLEQELFEVNGEETAQKETAPAAIAGLFNQKFTAIKDENHGKGLRKAMETVETYVKSKGFADGGDLQGTELLEAWAATLQKSKDGKGSKQLTAEELEADQIAQEWLNAKVKAMKEAHDKKLGTLTEQLTAAQQKSLRARVQREALAVLDAAQWVAGEDEATRQKRIDTVFRLLEYNHLQEDDKGSLIVVDDTGNPRKDATFNPVSFTDYIKEVNPFGFHQFDPTKKSPSPNPTPGKPGDAKPKIIVRDQAHYNELKKKNDQERDPAKRMALNRELHEAWIAQRPA